MSLATYGVISLASAFAPDYVTLYSPQTAVGRDGGGHDGCHLCPLSGAAALRYRGALSVYLAAGWPVGMLLALGATVWLLPWGWRAIIVLSSMGSLWALVVAYWVPESPYWLAGAGKQTQARAVIARLSRGAVQVPEHCRLHIDQTSRGHQRELFKAALCKVSVLQIAVNFTFSWGYWGLQTWLPTLLQQRGLNLPQSYGFIALSALCMIPGYMAASWLTHRLGRKKVIIAFISASVVAGYAFANVQSLKCSTSATLPWPSSALAPGACGGTWIAELYPTPLRTIGYGWAVFAQRVANILAPSIIGVLVAYGSSFNLTTTPHQRLHVSHRAAGGVYSGDAREGVAMSPVAGLWTNEYGSLMSLVVEGNKVSGVYQSSTGSTGQYEVSGYQLGTAATATQGQPVALAIDWHCVGKGTADPSWNWSSSLCGQISLQGKEEVLTLSHLLVASSDFAGLATQGTYVDKLVYRRPGRMQRAVPTGATTIASSVDNPLTGTWIAPDGTGLNLWIEATKEGRVGAVQGFLINAEGQTQVVGFTDIKAMASG